MNTETPISYGTITNECSCENENGEPTEYCYGDCWEDTVYHFSLAIKDLLEQNADDYWEVENLRLWNREVSGSFYADTVKNLLRGMTVESSWIMRYEVFADRVEYSLSHHDAPTGSSSVLRIAKNDEE